MTLEILIAGSVFIILNRLFNYVLIGMKENIKYLKIILIGTILNIIGNLYLIPIYSIEGAALSTLATELFVLVFSISVVHKSFNKYAN